MSFENTDDLAITGFTLKADKPKPYVKINPSEESASGYCERCKQRYFNAPVIKGVIVCNNCNK